MTIVNAGILHTAERNKETMGRSSLSFCQCSLGIAVSLQPSRPVSMLPTKFPINDSKIVGTSHCSQCLTYNAPVTMRQLPTDMRSRSLLNAGTSADMYRTVFELLVSVKLFLGRFDMRTMQVSILLPAHLHAVHGISST